MKATPFNPETDLPPIPFDEHHQESAAALKEAGLPWTPHVGCFVWDRDGHIQVSSPFPERIYFILNLSHFLRIFGTVEEIKAKLIWLPTYHQARLLCKHFGLNRGQISESLRGELGDQPGGELLELYELLLEKLRNELKS
jgi:hypothetical protein